MTLDCIAQRLNMGAGGYAGIACAKRYAENMRIWVTLYDPITCCAAITVNLMLPMQ